MTTTANLKIDHIAAAQAQKEVTANEAFDALDLAVTELLAKAMADADQTLSAAEWTRAVYLRLTGALTAARILTAPASRRLVVIDNATTGGYSITAKTAAGSGVTLAPSTRKLVYNDGADLIAVADLSSGMTVGGLADVALSGASAGQVLTWDGAHWLNHAPAVGLTHVSDMLDVSVASVQSGQVLSWSGSAWVNTSLSAGVVTLDGLSDVTVASPAAGDGLYYDAGTSQWKNLPAPFDVAGYLAGKPAAGATVIKVAVARPFTLPAALAGSQAHAGTAPQSTASFEVRKNGAAIGSISFAASAQSATFAMTNATSFAAGDRLEVIAPAAQDAALADVAITLLGRRS